MARFDHPRTNAHKKDAVLGILSAEFGHCGIQARLADGIYSSHLYIQLGDYIQSCLATGYGDYLLDLAFEDKRDEQVEKVDVADDVDFETVQQVLLERLWLLSPVLFRNVSPRPGTQGCSKVDLQNPDRIIGIEV